MATRLAVEFVPCQLKREKLSSELATNRAKLLQDRELARIEASCLMVTKTGWVHVLALNTAPVSSATLIRAYTLY